MTTRAGLPAGDLALLEHRLELHLPAAYVQGLRIPPVFTTQPISPKIENGRATVTQGFQRGLRSAAHNPRRDLKLNRILDRFGEVPPDRLRMPPPCGWLEMDPAANHLAGSVLASRIGQVVTHILVDGVLP